MLEKELELDQKRKKKKEEKFFDLVENYYLIEKKYENLEMLEHVVNVGVVELKKKKRILEIAVVGEVE